MIQIQKELLQLTDDEENIKNTYRYSGKLLKDWYSINKLRIEVRGELQSPLFSLIGGALLLSKGIESGYFLCNYSDRIKKIDRASKAGPKVISGLSLEFLLKVLGSVCWVISCALTGFSFVYVLPLKQMVLYTNTFGFVVSILKSGNHYYFNLPG